MRQIRQIKQMNADLLWKKYIPHFLWYVVRGVIVLGLCYIVLYPFFVKIVSMFKDYQDFLDPTVRFIPKHFTFNTIRRVMEKMDYWTALRNTAGLSLTIAVTTTFVSALVGYGLARFQFRGRGLLFGLSIFTLIVPPQTITMPLFLRFRDMGILDTPLPVILLALTGLSLKNGLFIFMFRQFFRNMPKELEEASYLDGCGAFYTYFKIMLPSSGSIILTSFLLSLSWQWTDVIYNGLYLSNFKMFSNVVSLAGAGEVPIMSASMTTTAALLSVIPIALIYLIAQNFFMQSVERSGIVG